MTSEQLRQHYLEALGIDSYVPRWPLPGAAPSPLFLDISPDEPPLNDELEGESAIAQPAPTRPDVAAVAAGLQASAAVRQRIDLDPKPEEPSPRSVGEAPAAGRSLRFTLNVWQINQNILVLDSRQDLALPVGRLLHNMVVALGLGSEALASTEPFRWPLTDSAELSRNQSESEARAAVQAFLAARLARQPLTHVWLMGAPAVRFGLHREQQTEAFRELLGKSLTLDIEGTSLEAIALPSLANILQYPEAKVAVWAAIKHLRKPRA